MQHCYKCKASYFPTEDGEHTNEECLENRVATLEDTVARLEKLLDN